MKGTLGLLGFSVVLLASPCAQADDWDAYNQWWLKHYYYFDPKAFTSIACDVDSSELDDGAANLLASHPALKAEPTLYKVSVDNAGHIQVSDPILQLDAVNPSAAVEVPLVKEMVQSKYQLLAESIDRDIQAVVGNYTPPDRRDEVIEKFVLTEDGAALTRSEPQNHGLSTITVHGPDFSSQTIQNVTIGGTAMHAQGVVNAHYDLVDGKYLLASQDQDAMQQAAGTQSRLVVKMTVDYQMVSGIRFPKTAEFKDGPGSDFFGRDDRVEFMDCKVTK
ncbi:MAG TPA: hypothetical protein VGH71_09415 [Gammaproteobacteria bacterium]|jgi:hypothetical protein